MNNATYINKCVSPPPIPPHAKFSQFIKVTYRFCSNAKNKNRFKRIQMDIRSTDVLVQEKDEGKNNIQNYATSRTRIVYALNGRSGVFDESVNKIVYDGVSFPLLHIYKCVTRSI